MADPAFVQKLVLEQIITVGSTLVYEAKVRGGSRGSSGDRGGRRGGTAAGGGVVDSCVMVPACIACSTRLPYMPRFPLNCRSASLTCVPLRPLASVRRCAATASGASWTWWPQTCSASPQVRTWAGLGMAGWQQAVGAGGTSLARG